MPSTLLAKLPGWPGHRGRPTWNKPANTDVSDQMGS